MQWYGPGSGVRSSKASEYTNLQFNRSVSLIVRRHHIPNTAKSYYVHHIYLISTFQVVYFLQMWCHGWWLQYDLGLRFAIHVHQ